MSRTRLTLGLVVGTVVAATVAIALLWIAGPSAPLSNRNNSSTSGDSDVDEEDTDLATESPPLTFATQVAPLLRRYCTDCHGVGKAKGGFSLTAHLDEASPSIAPDAWDRVARVIRSGQMPPAGRPRPEPTELATLTVWLDQTAARFRNPGRVTLRRLNRAEYNNTIRDLVGVTFQPADDFPADDSGDGFDTLGDVLSVSPTLIEKYLTAAETVVEAVAADANLWHRLRTPPVEDHVPYVLRGAPPQRDNAVKGNRVETNVHAAEIDRAYFALQAFADRAYRRPITHSEMARLMRFVEAALNNGEAADAGLKLAFKAILVSPHFLFRVEPDLPPGPDPDRPLTDFELASRLSYFLWSSMPDDELIRLAAAGKLHAPSTLAAQVRRMLRNPKSRALAENFAGQWLQTRALTEVTRDPARFPEFDADLLRAMRQETELFFDHVVREDRSILELLSADYTFVNERLAHHYGIGGVTGADFRRVSLAGTNRRGVLTHASVLTVTSGPTRTSPVKRGKWVLENLLGTPAPPPPPGVDTLQDDRGGKPATLREQLDRHRSRAECASCHARLDPLGYGLENFDAVGAWRDRDADHPIDPSGTLPDGRAFRGADELIALLAERPEVFSRCLTQQLLTYALGRSLGPADRPVIDRIVRSAIRNGSRFSSLAIALVRSDPFRKRSVRPEDTR